MIRRNGKMTLTFNPQIYGSLLAEVLPQPIANESEYQRVLAIIESLMHQNISTEEERMLNLFLILIEKFEADNYPIPCTSTPQRRLQHLIEANNLPATELVGIFGSVATLNDVLDGKKVINSNQAQQLADRFHLPATIFLA
jgi:HTH-type transcriptional regulator / antitoxin HigA